MKTKLVTLALIASIFISSCTSNEDENSTTTPIATGEISGTLNSNQTFAKGNYTLKGVVKIASGVTVTFASGSTITCDKSTGDNVLMVLNGGKLNINGTASEPVVFTEKSKVPGSWGGIVMYGNAPIKAASGATTAKSEDGQNLDYGGDNATHNGGSLKYVRVEYAGSKLGDGTKEQNGFTFYSVGSGTVLENLVSVKGADDGFEFFGGTVSASNLISYGNYDDAFDWQDGWSGQNSTNWYGYQEVKGNFGFEIEASNNNNSTFPIVTNITIKRAAGTVPEVPGTIEIDAFQFKKEGNGTFSNVIIDGYGDYTESGKVYSGAGIKIQDANTNTNQVNESKIKLLDVKISNTTSKIAGAGSVSVTFPEGTMTESTTATGYTPTAGNWATINGVSLIK